MLAAPSAAPKNCLSPRQTNLQADYHPQEHR